MQPNLSILSNGLRVASIAMPGLETAAISLTANVGARHEAAQLNGLAHLFEHMLFKGTGTRSARAIAEAIEDVGGSLNAWTSRDATCFHAAVLASDLPLAITLIADLVQDPRFDDGDLERERAVVLSEIGEALDLPDDLVFDEAQAAAFADQPLGRPVLGTADTLVAMEASHLRQWRDQHYRAPDLVMTAAGKVDHEALVRDAERLFGGLPATPGPSAEPARWAGGVRPTGRRGEQTHIVLAHEAPGVAQEERTAAALFATALGGGMSSRLFQELREERGLAYSVSASHGLHAEIGTMAIHVATRPRDAAHALDLARQVAADAATTLSPAELARARAQLKAALLMGLETPAGQAGWMAASLLDHGRLMPPAEAVARMEACTLEAVRAAGAAMLATRAALAIVGPGAERLAA